MTEILLILSYICSKEMLMCVPLLLIVGYLVKHYTTIPNASLPYIETGMGLAVGLLYGGLIAKGWNNVIMYGGQGVVLGFISISLYDAVHGVVKHKCNSEDLSMKDKKKINLWEHRAFVYGLAFLGGVILTGLGKLIMGGVDGLVYYLVNEAVYSVLTLLVVDFLIKYSTDKTLLTWQYWVMMAIMVLAVISYAVASLMTTWPLVWAFIVGAVVLVAGAGLWCNKLYKPSIQKKAEAVHDTAVNAMIDMTGLPRAKCEEITNYYLEVK